MNARSSLADIILGKEQYQDDNYTGYRPSLDYAMQKSLREMQSKLGITKVLKEHLGDEELDFELEEDDD